MLADEYAVEVDFIINHGIHMRLVEPRHAELNVVLFGETAILLYITVYEDKKGKGH